MTTTATSAEGSESEERRASRCEARQARAELGSVTRSEAAIEFWFDFISPFGYLASLRIDALGARHGREARWQPLLIGVTVLKVMGLKPLMETPLKADYARREIARYLRRHRLALARSIDTAPMNPLPCARAFAWLLDHDAAAAKPFARAALHAYWADGRDLGTPAAAAAVGVAGGIDAGAMREATESSAAAAALRARVEAAVALGVFGSPFFRIGDEAFFGVDKLELIDSYLAEGGW